MPCNQYFILKIMFFRSFQFDFIPRQSHNRSVRFDDGSAAAIASHDYRVAHAAGKSDSRNLQTGMLHSLKKSGLKFESNPALPTTSTLTEDDFEFRRLPKSTTTLTDDDYEIRRLPKSTSTLTDDDFPNRRLPKSPKKHAAPPPPPPPPAVMVAKAENRSQNFPQKSSAALKGIE
jgi:hypothetical protein